MSNITIPAALRDNLPADLDLDRATITTYGALCDGHDVGGASLGGIEDDAPVVILPGWTADDGNADVEYPDAESADEAAQEYVSGGDWGGRSETSWVQVYTWRTAITLDEDGDPVTLTLDKKDHTVEIEAEEPECVANEHDWQSPIEVVGGIKENPGVHGHGGGVIITEVCAHCGMYRVTDTWAQNPSTGEQGLTSVRYEDADDASMEWIEALQNE